MTYFGLKKLTNTKLLFKMLRIFMFQKKNNRGTCVLLTKKIRQYQLLLSDFSFSKI